MRRVERNWVPARHIALMEQKIMGAVFDPHACKRLMFLEPPRHGKSTYVSKYLPAKFLDWFPWGTVVLTSYEAAFARRWGRRARNLILTHPGCFRIRVSKEQSAGNDWEVHLPYETDEPAGGAMITAGTGGAITGTGGNLIIIDDPIKNFEEADSQVYRDKAWDWYTGTLRDRLEPGGVIILAMQRWHEDDLAGRLIKEMAHGGEEWDVTCLPALAEEGDPLGRACGEALWPQRYPRDVVLAAQAGQGSYKFAAKWQQNPKPPEGQLIQRSCFKYFEVTEHGSYLLHDADGAAHEIPVDNCWRFQSCDPAATEGDASHYFVLETWAVTPALDMLLLDIVREKAETTKHLPLMRSARARYEPAVQVVEKQIYGLAIIQQGILEGLPVQPIDADKSKLARALPLQSKYENGKVYHRLGAPWLTEYEDEITAFPKGTYNDQVDAAAHAVNYLASHTPAKESHLGVSRGRRVSAGVDW